MLVLELDDMIVEPDTPMLRSVGDTRQEFSCNSLEKKNYNAPHSGIEPLDLKILISLCKPLS